MITDDPIRDLERQLVTAATRENASADRSRRDFLVPRRRRWAVGLGIAGVACAGIVAGAPLGLFGGGDAQNGASVLRVAAAVAADQPSHQSVYRYTSLIERQTYAASHGARQASVTLEQPVERWIDRDGKGRQILHDSRVVARTGDSALQSTLPSGLQAPGEQSYPPPRSQSRRLPVEDLPTDAGELLRTLRVGYREGRISADGSAPSPAWEDFQVTIVILQLLSDANATPAQRAALFGALARMPSAISQGSVTDSLGREGEGVSIETPAADPLPPARFEVIFNSTTSALLSWTVTNDVAAPGRGSLTARSYTIVRAAQVGDSNARP